MKRVFIDTDIILDMLARREPFYKYSAILFSLIDTGKIKGFISSLIIANLHYILSKQKSKNLSIKSLRKLKALVGILAVDEKIIELALSSDFNDLENSIQYYTAVENKIGFLITRNVKDYKNPAIMILTAEEFLNIYFPNSGDIQ